MKQVAKRVPKAPDLDLVETLEQYLRLQRDAKTLSDQLRTVGDGDMHGHLRVILSTIERIRINVRALLREA